MKILTRKQQNEFLKRIADCQIICNNYLEVMEALDKIKEEIRMGSVILTGIIFLFLSWLLDGK